MNEARKEVRKLEEELVDVLLDFTIMSAVQAKKATPAVSEKQIKELHLALRNVRASQASESHNGFPIAILFPRKPPQIPKRTPKNTLVAFLPTA